MMSNNDPQEQQAQAGATTMESYRFYDGDFVAWWLHGLYLFEPEDQIAIAELLHDRVHIPEVQDVILDFVNSRREGSNRSDSPAFRESPDEPVKGMTARETAVASFIRAWNEQRALFIMMFAIAAVFAAKGAWSIFRAVADLVT